MPHSTGFRVSFEGVAYQQGAPQTKVCLEEPVHTMCHKVNVANNLRGLKCRYLLSIYNSTFHTFIIKLMLEVWKVGKGVGRDMKCCMTIHKKTLHTWPEPGCLSLHSS